VVRNELVVALGDILIVTEADLGSGSMRSVAYALEMGKEIWVLPQRLDESLATNKLLSEGKAFAIHNIESFASRFGTAVADDRIKDDFFYFCQTSPTLEESVKVFGARVYEAELEEIITIRNGIVNLA
ncbi:MAG: DNA-processing protein DprA, partial [Epsilonproteobacteria bacterium]